MRTKHLPFRRSAITTSKGTCFMERKAPFCSPRPGYHSAPESQMNSRIVSGNSISTYRETDILCSGAVTESTRNLF